MLLNRKSKIILGVFAFTVITFGLGSGFDATCEYSCIGQAFADNHEIKFFGVTIDGDDDDSSSSRQSSPFQQDFADDLKTIEIKSVRTNWLVGASPDAKVHLTFKDFRSEKDWEINASGGNLAIKVLKKGPLEAILLVPASFGGGIQMATVSGDLKFTSLGKAQTLAIESVSGELKLDTIPQTDLALKTVSGEVFLTSVEATPELKIRIETVSGGINASLNKPMSNFKVSSVSGEFELALSKGIGFDFDLSGVSSDFNGLPDLGTTKTNRPGHRKASGSFGSEPRGKLEFSSVSGDFNLKL